MNIQKIVKESIFKIYTGNKDELQINCFEEDLKDYKSYTLFVLCRGRFVKNISDLMRFVTKSDFPEELDSLSYNQTSSVLEILVERKSKPKDTISPRTFFGSMESKGNVVTQVSYEYIIRKYDREGNKVKVLEMYERLCSKWTPTPECVSIYMKYT